MKKFIIAAIFALSSLSYAQRPHQVIVRVSMTEEEYAIARSVRESGSVAGVAAYYHGYGLVSASGPCLVGNRPYFWVAIANDEELKPGDVLEPNPKGITCDDGLKIIVGLGIEISPAEKR